VHGQGSSAGPALLAGFKQQLGAQPLAVGQALDQGGAAVLYYRLK
jgi:hypothetical protein